MKSVFCSSVFAFSFGVFFAAELKADEVGVKGCYFQNKATSQNYLKACGGGEALTAFRPYLLNNRVDLFGFVGSYHGLHFRKNQHLFVNADIHYLNEFTKKSIINKDIKLLSYQYGNLSQDSYVFAIGVLAPAFALGWHPFSSLFFDSDKDIFYKGPKYGAKVTFDNLQQNFVEFAINAGALYQEDMSVSLRFLRDVSSKYGTRLAFSGYASKLGQRRIAFSWLQRGKADSGTFFEWVRVRTTPDGKDTPFAQLLRLAVKGQKNNGSQISFVYDDIRLSSRKASIIQQKYFTDDLSFLAALSYEKNEALKNFVFILSLGMDFRI